MNILSSPSAILFILGLTAIVVLQIAGDIQQSIQHAKSKGKKQQTSRINYLPSDSLRAGFVASRYALYRHKQRALQLPSSRFNPKATTKVSWPLILAALSLLTVIFWLEGLMAVCILALLYIALMTTVGLLAWPGNAKNNFNDKLAIALLAPYSAFLIFD